MLTKESVMRTFATPFGIAVLFGTSAALAAPSAAVAQTMPACAAGDPVVWENTSTKVYHLKGDKYYGTTKHGTYACKSAADSAGYHAAKMRASGSAASAASSAPDAAGSPDPGASPMKHHHHHKTAASPSPEPTGT